MIKTIITIESFMADITHGGPDQKVVIRPCADIYISIGDVGFHHSAFRNTPDNLNDALPVFVEMAADLVRSHQKEKSNAPDPS